MVIYGNNLAEKLFGVALSKDHLRFATPYCELVDDPDFAVDINLAVDLNSSLEGDRVAARRLVETLVLNSAMLDWSTINFYVDKMTPHPYFQGEIARINSIFNDPNYPNFRVGDNGSGTSSFKEALKDAASDCLNSPCNVFSATSDSIGRLAQTAANKNSQNTFDLGDLKDTATNIFGGVDQAIFNSIPAAFQEGIIEVTSTAKQAWTNTQAIMMGKGNIAEATKNALENGSMRSSIDKILDYTPDVKSFFDLDQISGTLLTEISDSLGGCFDKFQHAVRYNPYSDNNSVPLGVTIGQVNGVPYSASPGGVWKPAGVSMQAADDCTNITGSQSVAPPPSDGSVDPASFNRIEVTAGDEISKDKTYWISKPATKRDEDKETSWPTFGSVSWDKANKAIYPAQKTLDKWVDASDASAEGKALKGEVKLKERERKANKDSLSSEYIVTFITSDWELPTVEEDFCLPIEEMRPGVWPYDGVAISDRIVKDLSVVESGLSKLDYGVSVQKAIDDNKLFLVVRRVGECAKIVRVVVYKEDYEAAWGVDPSTYKFIYGEWPKGSKNEEYSNKSAVKEAGFTVYNLKHVHAGDTEIRVAIGDYEDIREAVTASIPCGEIQDSSGWRDYLQIINPGMLSPLIIGEGGSRQEKEDRAIGLLNPLLVQKLIELSKEVGTKIQMTSGRRTREYMFSTGQGKSFRPGSQHNLGKAADIKFTGIGISQLDRAATKIGFTGIGRYSTFLHVDVRRPPGSRVSRW